jgi:hypothetical protein
MPNINLPIVKPQADGQFVCPKCSQHYATHPAFVEHYAAAHVPAMQPPRRGPQFERKEGPK